jgi:PAS domain S-box-containing protein
MAAPLDFQAVFETTANPYMLLDRELRYVAANRAYLQVTASRLEDLIGRRIFEVFPNDARDPNNRSAQVLRQSLEKVLRTRRRDVIAFLPYRVARTAGAEPEERYWSATHTPLFDEAGEVAFILQHTVDVTELHALQRMARTFGVDIRKTTGTVESEVLHRAQSVQDSNTALDVEIRMLRQMFDQAPGFTAFLRGPAHVVEIANAASERLVGRGDLVGKPLRQALPDVAGQGFFELLDRVYETREPFVGRGAPMTLVRKPGGDPEEVFVDFVMQPIIGPNGATVGILVQGNDVTELSRNEVRQRFLARASEHLATASEDIEQTLHKVAAAAVEGFADGCVVDLLGADGSMRRVAFAGADPDWQARAIEAESFAPGPGGVPDHPIFDENVLRPTLIRNFTDEMAVRYARGPAHLRWMRAIAVRSLMGLPLIARGRRVGILTWAMSSTRRRFDAGDLAMVEELGRMASTVMENALLSRERDELLASAEAARERAEAANQAKDEFLAMLGHELRNPLSPILTAVQLLKLRGDGSSTREQTIIERQAQHLIRLVDDLLDVSRITRGKVQLQKVPTDIATVIATAVEMASPLFEQKQHRLHLDVAPHTLFVDGDAMRLGQVVSNLLTNAARYTQEGGDIHVSARASDDEVIVRVRDNGMGIAPDVLPGIFDMFVQGPRRTDRAEGGLGLGLTLVRTLVQMHGGSVIAASDGIGHGSEFVVRLPRLAPAAAERPASETGPRPVDTSACHVLVVDDNVDAAQLLADLLEIKGYTTAVAHDGPSALTEAKRQLPDVAVLDIGLPVMDGYELAAQLRATLGARAPAMVALTGYGQLHDRKRSHAAGFAAHLVKPVDADALLRTLAALRDSRHPHRDAS